MGRVERGPAHQIRCATCGQVTPDYDIVNYGSSEDGYRELCNQCLNAEVAKSDGLDKFEHVRFNPVEIADCTGEAHVFHFRTRLFGLGVALNAFELHDGIPPVRSQNHLVAWNRWSTGFRAATLWDVRD